MFTDSRNKIKFSNLRLNQISKKKKKCLDKMYMKHNIL